MTIEEIHALNGRFGKFGYTIVGDDGHGGASVMFLDDEGKLRTETATLDQLEAAYPVLEKEYNAHCAALELEPAAVNIKNVEAKFLSAGRDALDKLLDCADDEDASDAADAAKAKYLRMAQAVHGVFPREIADDLCAEIFIRLRLSYGVFIAEWLTV